MTPTLRRHAPRRLLTLLASASLGLLLLPPSAGANALGLLLLPPSAGANALGITVSPDAAEDRPFEIAVTGVATETLGAFATVRPAGGAGCDAGFGEDVFATLFSGFGGVSGTFRALGTDRVDDPGDYLACAYLQDSSGDRIAQVRGASVFAVRAHRASLALQAPAEIAEGEALMLQYRGSTEVPRAVLARVTRAGGAGCGASYEASSGDAQDRVDVAGDFATSLPIEDLPPGRHLVCGWVHEGYGRS